MSLESANKPPLPAEPDPADDSYVDPILFAEGAYVDQQDYKRAIDELADRINRGVAVPRGREVPDPRLSKQALFDAEYNKMYRAVEALELDLRVVFVMHHLEGLSHQEIAKALNISQGAVASREAMAIRLIGREIRHTEDDNEGLPAR